MYEHTTFYIIMAAGLAGILTCAVQLASKALDWLAQQGFPSELVWWFLVMAAGCIISLWGAERVKK